MIIPALTGASFARWRFFDYRAAVAVATGTYRIRVTSFESVNTGDLIASR
jgi:hypothetical protein